MKQLDLQQKQLVPVMKPHVIIEEITPDDVQPDSKQPLQASSGQSVRSETLPSTASSHSEVIQAVAYIGGSSAAFLIIFLAYSCCQLHCSGKTGDGKGMKRIF